MTDLSTAIANLRDPSATVRFEYGRNDAPMQTLDQAMQQANEIAQHYRDQGYTAWAGEPRKVQPETAASLQSAVNRAVTRLRDAGHVVGPADIPGLWNVSGHPELTTGQLMSIAGKL